MVPGYVVLAAGTPPNSAKVVAIFVTGPEQNDATCKTRAETFRDTHFPTSVVQSCSIDDYNTGVVINP